MAKTSGNASNKPSMTQTSLCIEMLRGVEAYKDFVGDQTRFRLEEVAVRVPSEDLVPPISSLGTMTRKSMTAELRPAILLRLEMMWMSPAAASALEQLP